jgi:glycosyltransferase involved in cell wall biosynthesis
MESPFPKTLLVIPVCGHSRALRPVVEHAMEQGLPVLLVDPNSDDGDLALIANLPVGNLRLTAGRGKGRALVAGAALAKEQGYGAILAFDADGQHDPAHVGLLLDAARTSWPAIVIGTSVPETADIQDSRPPSRDFSAFWVRLECGHSLPDTRSGFRLYPVDFLTSRHFFASGRGFGVETLVRGAWAGLPLLTVKVPTGRLPAAENDILLNKFRDTLRIVFLHTLLLIRSLLPWPHSRIVPKTATENPWSLLTEPLRFFRLLCREHASAIELAAASWVGIFIGALPIIPFGIVTIVYVNHKLHLNKLAGVAASNVCVFPFVPFLCVEVGYFLRFGSFWSEFNRQTMLHEIHYRLWEWLLGALVVGPIIGFAGALLTYMLVRYLRSTPGKKSWMSL